MARHGFEESPGSLAWQLKQKVLREERQAREAARAAVLPQATSSPLTADGAEEGPPEPDAAGGQ